jgi:hypothetical protein
MSHAKPAAHIDVRVLVLILFVRNPMLLAIFIDSVKPALAYFPFSTLLA